MKKTHIFLVLSIMFSLLLVSCESEELVDDDTVYETTITGQVIDAETGSNLSGAIIKISEGTTVQGTTSGSDGTFSTEIDLSGDTDLEVIVFMAGYFQDTTSVFALVDETTEVPLFELQRDESSNAGSFSGVAASIYLSEESASFVGVKESGSIESAQIVFEVMDSSGIVIGEDNAITVSFRFGDTPGGGEYLYPSSITTNALGKAAVSLNTGTIAGVCQIVAEAVVDGKPIKSKPVLITIHGGFPDLDHFSLGPEYVNYAYYNKFNGEAKISVLVGDKYTNPVREGTSVYFSSEAGVIEGSEQTNKLGQATVTLLSGNPLPYDDVLGHGYFYVHASTINESEETISNKSLLLFSSYPVVTLSTNTAFDSVYIGNGGSQSFSYTVVDIFGHPLAHDNNYSVVVETDGSAGAAGDISIKMGDVLSGTPTYYFKVLDTDDEKIDEKAITVRVVSDGPNGRAVSQAAIGITR